MVEIRTGTPKDVDGLVDLWVEFMDYHCALDSGFVRATDATIRWAEYITAKLVDDRFVVLVADAGDSLAGYTVATEIDYPPITTITSYGFLQEIAVTERFRRRGIGEQLFEAAEQWLLARGIQQIEVKVDILNAGSRAFWASAGFSPHTETLIKKYPTAGHRRCCSETDPGQSGSH